MAAESQSHRWENLRLDRPQDGIALVSLHRPGKRNALSIRLRQEFSRVLEILARDDSVRVLVLTGSDGVFTAGLDLDEWAGSDEAQESGSARALGAGAFDAETDPVAALRRLGKPVVGAIDGPCITGGLEIALACDLLVATEGARFADTHVRVGLLPGWGGSVRLAQRVGPARARELALTGRALSAQEALAWGLVNRVVASGALIAQACELAAAIAAHPPQFVRAYRDLLQSEMLIPAEKAYALEAQAARDHNLRVSRAELLHRLEAIRRG